MSAGSAGNFLPPVSFSGQDAQHAWVAASSAMLWEVAVPSNMAGTGDSAGGSRSNFYTDGQVIDRSSAQSVQAGIAVSVRPCPPGCGISSDKPTDQM